MRLQIESMDVSEVHSGTKTKVVDRVLHIDLKELERLILQDEHIRSVALNLVRPGDPVRMVNVVDIIQPRCKLDPENQDFPGWLGKLSLAGQGRTRALQGIGVVLSNRVSRRPYASMFDMFGVGGKISAYGSMRHLHIDPVPAEGTGERDFDSAVKLAGLKAAVYLAQSGEGHPVDRTEVYDLDLPGTVQRGKSSLPRVAYYYQLHTPQHDYKGTPDPILYGSEVNGMFPTIMHPNEILDGALVNPHTMRCQDTYSIQNHAVIRELYNRHGKDLIFVGVVVGVASLEPTQRQRMVMMASHLVANVLGAEGVIMTKAYGGMPHVDLAETAEACEKRGVKTTLFVMLWHTVGSISDQIYFNPASLNAVINVGQICERYTLPRAEKILGGTPETRLPNPDVVQRAGDETVEMECFLVAGVVDMLGGSRTIGVEY
jgi:sarcosine reductase